MSEMQHGKVESVNVEGGRAVVGLEGLESRAGSHRGRALWAYPIEHYPFWQTVRAQAGLQAWGAPLAPGAVGEHLTLSGLVEPRAWVGDLLRFPDCTLAISEPHRPGLELGEWMGFPHAVRLMTQSGWSGFWLAVRVPGTIRSGEAFELVPGPREVGIAELFRARRDG